MKRIILFSLLLALISGVAQACDCCYSSSSVTAADDHEPVVTMAALNRVLPIQPQQQVMDDQVSAGSAAQPSAQLMPEQPKRAAVGAGFMPAGAGLVPGTLLTDSPQARASNPFDRDQRVVQMGLLNFNSYNVTINNNGMGLQAGATARRGSFVQVPQPQVGVPAGSSAGAAGSNDEPDVAPVVSTAAGRKSHGAAESPSVAKKEERSPEIHPQDAFDLDKFNQEIPVVPALNSTLWDPRNWSSSAKEREITESQQKKKEESATSLSLMQQPQQWVQGGERERMALSGLFSNEDINKLMAMWATITTQEITRNQVWQARLAQLKQHGLSSVVVDLKGRIAGIDRDYQNEYIG